MLKGSEQKAVYQSMTVPAYEDRDYMGLGFHLSEIAGHKRIVHNGGDPGYRSFLYMVPERDMGFVFLTNCDYGEEIRWEVLNALGEKLLSED